MSDSYLLSKERCPACAELGNDTTADKLVGTVELEILLDRLLLEILPPYQ